MSKVWIGTVAMQLDGTIAKDVRTVEFEGELLARHQRRISDDGGLRQRLFRTDNGRYIVSTAEWTTDPLECTTYTLREIAEADLLEGGRFEDLGRAWRGEALDLDMALTIEEALELIERRES